MSKEIEGRRTRHILDGAYLDRRHDPAIPDRRPVPRPDLKVVQRPVGPVAVFGASNFPLAFSTAGGDTAAALAAGCPVLVKGHSAHPGTSEIVAQAVHAARKRLGLHPGVFSLIQGGNRQVGEALVQHPLVKAVGFTGSLAGGRALYNLCAARPEPIPFFGELGSTNPVFFLPGALARRGSEIAAGWVASLSLGAGQFCTNPGVAVMMEDANAESFVKTAISLLREIAPQTMLTRGIAAAFEDGFGRLAGRQSVRELLRPSRNGRDVTPGLYETDGDTWLADADLHEEMFGPAGLIVKVRDAAQMVTLAKSLEGQLTCTLHLAEGDVEFGQRLMPILDRKAGRVLANGFPTGVEVADAMVHGGPYPASTNFGATSVGTLSIRRFLRPVCYQAMPDELLPIDLRQS